MLHTSDWHLGRTLYGISLLEDQAHVLDLIVEAVKDQQPDLVIIVGDIFDRATPSEAAIALFDQTLNRLIQDCKVRVVVLPGQQDSATRLSFGSWMMEKRGLHIITTLEQALSPIHLEDADGPLHLNAIPYLDPFVVSQHFRTQKVDSHSSAGTVLLEHLTRFRRLRKRAVRGLVAAYLLLEGGELSGSERPMGRPGETAVKLDTLQSLSYGALGYLHRAQALGPDGELCYSGSPLALSFEEANETKTIQRVDIDAEGFAHIQQIPLTPRRRFHRYEGALKSLLLGPPREIAARDLCSLTLTGETGPLNPEQVDKLRQQYPNLLRIERRSAGGDLAMTPTAASLPGLFANFYQSVTGEDLDSVGRDIIRQVLTSQ